MNANTLSRSAGVAAMASGILFIGIQAIHPSDVLASVSTDRWVIVHGLGIAMCLFGLLGVAGLYARQVNAAGWTGLAGYLLMTLFYTLSLGFQFVEAFVSPALATASPGFVEGILGIASGDGAELDMGSLPAVYAVTGGMYLLGGVLFGVATFRAGILPRPAGALLAIATILPVAGAAVPHPYDRAFAVPMGLALTWLGYALWADRRQTAATSVAAGDSARLHPAGAE
jgi:hypothetical protein